MKPRPGFPLSAAGLAVAVFLAACMAGPDRPQPPVPSTESPPTTTAEFVDNGAPSSPIAPTNTSQGDNKSAPVKPRYNATHNLTIAQLPPYGVAYSGDENCIVAGTKDVARIHNLTMLATWSPEHSLAETLDFYSDDLFGDQVYDYRSGVRSPFAYHLDDYAPLRPGTEVLVLNFQGHEPAVHLEQSVAVALAFDYDGIQPQVRVQGCTYSPPPI